jgi:hypothetical protein
LFFIIADLGNLLNIMVMIMVMKHFLKVVNSFCNQVLLSTLFTILKLYDSFGCSEFSRRNFWQYPVLMRK